MDKPLSREYSLMDLLKRPSISYNDIENIMGEVVANKQICEQVEIKNKYEGYISRQLLDIERMRRYEDTKIPLNLDYSIIEGLSNEVKMKLAESKPETLGRASRVPGVTPAAVSLLLVYMKKNGLLERVKVA
jgi:tRNA uridine 5-carboxymethylaminomethyl modification enzyme